jgi:hypothetical protein
MSRLFKLSTLLLMFHVAAAAADDPTPFQLVRSDENYNPNIHQGLYAPAPE